MEGRAEPLGVRRRADESPQASTARPAPGNETGYGYSVALYATAYRSALRTSRIRGTTRLSEHLGLQPRHLPMPRDSQPTPYTPYTLHHTSYTLYTLHTIHPTHHTPYTIHHTPYTMHHTPYTIHPTRHAPFTPYTLHPTPYTLHPTTYTLLPELRLDDLVSFNRYLSQVTCEQEAKSSSVPLESVSSV